jgi:hypothetical protein
MLLNINICDSKQKNFQLLKAQLNYNRNINRNKKKKHQLSVRKENI